MLGAGFGLKGSLVGSATQGPTDTDTDKIRASRARVEGKDDGWLAERSVVP